MSTPSSYAIKLRASSPKIALEVGLDFAFRGFELNPNATYELLIDQPVGYALLATSSTAKKLIIATDNACSEYLLDLQAKGVAAIVPLAPYITLWQDVTKVFEDEHVAPVYSSRLTPTERLTLHCVARGLDNKQIAKRRDVSEGVVKNTLTSIYEKLKLSRDEIVHYYLGHSYMLTNWKLGLPVTSTSVQNFDSLTDLMAA